MSQDNPLNKIFKPIKQNRLLIAHRLQQNIIYQKRERKQVFTENKITKPIPAKDTLLVKKIKQTKPKQTQQSKQIQQPKQIQPQTTQNLNEKEIQKKSKKEIKINKLKKTLQQNQEVFISETIFNNHCQKNLQQLDSYKVLQEILKLNIKPSFINCDVRYFNFDYLTSRLQFDVVLIDPPWRIKGGQQNDSQFMFTNCKFSLDYNTMSHSQIESIPINLFKSKVIFLWILNTQASSAIEMLNKWGFEVRDQIIWVKLKDGKINLSHGYYFMHSYQVCLVGVKPQIKLPKSIFNNVLFAQVLKKSQKPYQLYEMIELLLPDSKKCQIFARNNNLRGGWFSMGNQIGQAYDTWLLTMSCDKCQKKLNPGIHRYKSKKIANYDLCQQCIQFQSKEEFYFIQNQVDQDVIHLYCKCNKCNSEPIWGCKFSCLLCEDYDLCQSCFDKNLQGDHFHPVQHEMKIIEFPVYGHGFPIHDYKCNSCFQKPMIGVCFACKTCKNYNLCQKCFFQKNEIKWTKSHKQDHRIRPINKKLICFNCSKTINSEYYLCQNCYNFYFCESCYQKREEFKSNLAHSHKHFHKFLKIC